ncbi:MAG TPA: site-2 protease family protein [Candidatus Angelobacter sp.]|nr:site-2 protease family protein [Candidatus Angelobacter sp.]
MRSHIKLGRVFGIEIGIHYSWFIIAFLIAFSLADQFRVNNHDWSPELVWAAAILTAVLFFLCLLAHELSHSLVARAYKLPVREITLFALGGVSVIEKESPNAKSEFLIAIVGPLTSAVIGGAMLLAASALGGTRSSAVIAILFWLGTINLMLAGFNMLPGFPLDGGRVLRAIVWGITGNMERATKISARVGQAMAVLFIGAGIYEFFRGAGVGGLWIAFIGWFLLQAAGANYLEVELKHTLAGIRARDLMSRDCAQVPGYISVQEFVDEFVLRTGRRCFLVNVQDRIAGMITPHEVRSLDRSQWGSTPVQQIMKPLEKLHAVTPETGVLEALEVMSREDLNQLPVVSDHQVEGMISRGNILEAIRSRRELGGSNPSS